MKRTLAIIFSLLACSLYAQQNSNQPVKISSVPYPFHWITPPSSYDAGSDKIVITAGAKTDLYCFVDGSYYVNTAPKLVFKPDSNFIFSVKVKPTFANLYDGGALLLYSDESNWAKILFEKHTDGTTGLGVSLVRDKFGDDSYHAIGDAPEVFVKVARAASIFNFYFSLDGKSWTLLRTFPYKAVDNLRIGFYAQSPKGDRCDVEFSEIRYKGEKFKNFFAGE